MHEALERIEFYESQARFHTARVSGNTDSTRLSLRRPRLIDLGSGDGRVCIAAAEHYQYEATGVEVQSPSSSLLYSVLSSFILRCIRTLISIFDLLVVSAAQSSADCALVYQILENVVWTAKTIT